MAPLRTLFGNDADILTEPQFQVVLLATVMAPLGTVVASPILDSLIEPYGTTPANIGLMMSFFTAPAIVMIPVAGVLADRWGRKPILVAALVLSGVAGSALAFTTDYRVVLGLRFLQGVGFAGIVPILITAIGDLYDGARESTGQGLRLTVVGMSATVFPLFAGVLVVVAWQYPFLLYAAAIPIAVVVWWRFEEPAGGRPLAVERGPDDASYRRELLGLLRRPRVLSLVVARTLPMVIWIGFVTYNSLIVVRFFGGTAPQAGLVAAGGSVGSAVAASQAGRITDVFDSRLWPLIIAHCCLGGGFGLMLYAPALPAAAAGIVVCGVGLGTTGSMYRSIITGLAPRHLRAGLVSVAESGGRLTVTLTPIAMGTVIAATSGALGFNAAVRLAGTGAIAVGVIGGIACLLVANASPPVPVEGAVPADD